MTISLCMICRDNENTIEAALQSAVGVFDEIVVVDTGSKDSTMDIVKKYTSKVFQIEWEDDFAKARNYGLDRARGDLIFWMDSDDVIPPETAEGLRVIAKDNNPSAAYMIQIHNVLPAGFEDLFLNDYYHLKVFPNRKDIRFENTVQGHMHEGVVDAIVKLPIEIRYTDLSIIHHGYETEELFERKIQRDIRICMNSAGEYSQFRIGKNFFVLHNNELSMWVPKNEKKIIEKCDVFNFGEQKPWTDIIDKANAMIRDFREGTVNCAMEFEKIQNSFKNMEVANA